VVAVDVWMHGGGTEFGKASGIGAQRLIRVGVNVTTRKVRLRILKSGASPCISEFGLFAEPL
jgi:alpha-L-fucosidase